MEFYYSFNYYYKGWMLSGVVRNKALDVLQMRYYTTIILLLKV
jgi:hypothetical protein